MHSPILPVAAVFLSFAVFSGCSFNYDTELTAGEAIPEMVMTRAAAYRYEDSRLSIVLNAGALEIYDADQVWAGSDVSFVQYAPDGSDTVDAEGAAGLVLIDENSEIYTLGKQATFHLKRDDLFLRASDLRWCKKTHRLNGPLAGEVELERGDGSSIRGTGFYADTLSRFYRFSDAVQGRISGKQIASETPPPPGAPGPDGEPESGSVPAVTSAGSSAL